MIGRILVPLDGGPESESALRFAMALPAESITILGVIREIETDLAKLPRYVDDLVGRLRAEGRNATMRIVEGDPAERIVEAAVEHDLVVMTTHARGAGGRLIYGSFADRVARHATTPVILLRAGEDLPEPVRVNRVVVPLDGSALSEEAVGPAISMARDLNAKLHLVRVADPAMLYATAAAVAMTTEAYETVMNKIADEARAELQTIKNRVSGDVSVSTDVRQGNPADELIEAIVPHDLIVMTTHGHGGMKRWFLGSVAERMVRQAHTPVMIVRTKAQNAPTR